MSKTVTVYFGPDEAGEQRKFLNAMNGIGIIEITKEEISSEMKAFEGKNVGFENKLVLHDADEEDRFDLIMKIFFPNKEYPIVNGPN